MPLDLNRLNGPQRKIVRDAFLDAFDTDSLDELLQDNDKPPLEHLVPRNDFGNMVFKLILLTRREGWTGQLIQFAENKSANQKIQTLRDVLERTVAIELDTVEKNAVKHGGLERIVKKGGFSDWTLWVNQMTATGHRICRIEYTDGVIMGGGTGFLVADDLVLTNYHVVEAQIKGRLAPEKIICRFDFVSGPQAPDTGNTCGLDASGNWLVDASPYSPHDPGDRNGVPATDHLDYALLRLSGSPGKDDIGGQERGAVTVREQSRALEANDILVIGQHPEGLPLKLSWGAVLKNNGNGTRILYNANTEKGSSGSPCFNEKLELVALHHAGDPDYSKLLGDYNQGIPMGRIIDRMKRVNNEIPKFWQ